MLKKVGSLGLRYILKGQRPLKRGFCNARTTNESSLEELLSKFRMFCPECWVELGQDAGLGFGV